MSTRTAYPGTPSAGDTLTVTNFAKLPGGWIGQESATSDQGSITSETDVASCSVTVTAGSSRRLKITGMIKVESTIAGDRAALRIYRGATMLQGATVTLPNANTADTVNVIIDDTPSSGSNTYKLTVDRVTGSGTLTVKATSTAPSKIIVEDIGPSS